MAIKTYPSSKHVMANISGRCSLTNQMQFWEHYVERKGWDGNGRPCCSPVPFRFTICIPWFSTMFPSLAGQKLHFLSPISIKTEIKIVKFYSSLLSILSFINFLQSFIAFVYELPNMVLIIISYFCATIEKLISSANSITMTIRLL